MIRSSVVTVRPRAFASGVRRLLGALERRGDEVGDVAVADALRDPLRHLLATRREVVAGRAAVEDALRVVHLPVPEQVDQGLHAVSFRAAAAALAAAGSAVAIRSRSSSVCADERNQASYALGGR